MSSTSHPSRLVAELPLKFRRIFPFECFNPVQSQSFDKIYQTDRSAVICGTLRLNLYIRKSHICVLLAPTGSGKTVILELAILRYVQSPTAIEDAKILYIAPIKALCGEKAKEWREKFSGVGLTVCEITGDTESNEHILLKKNNIIVTTPEKWDSITRHWFSHKEMLEKIHLVLIDEVHILSERRGSTLESIVSRMKTRNGRNLRSSSCRFVATSATIPNWNDIAEWIGKPLGPAECLVFGDEYRPVPLRKIVEGYPMQTSSNEFKFDTFLNYQLPDIIDSYSDDRPTLIFCSTRKSCVLAAEFLCRQRRHKSSSSGSCVRDKKLKELLAFGIAFHHAGLTYEDRSMIERLFIEGQISVLFATSTLAVGVNLPAHLVIIKSTLRYVDRRFQEYSELDILQMMGRAGRPQFDSCGTVVIMTDTRNASKYESLANGRQNIESKLSENLTESLNAEFSLGTVNNLKSAKIWLQSTFFYVRAQSNPSFYFQSNYSTNIETCLNELLMETLEKLKIGRLILHNSGNDCLSSSIFGRMMAKYYLRYLTMTQFTNLIDKYRKISNVFSEITVFTDILVCLSKAEELSEIRYQPGEKKFLNQLVSPKSLLYNQVKYKLPVENNYGSKLREAWQKVFLLLQVYLADITVCEKQQSCSWNSFQMTQDISWIIQQGSRLVRCFLECLMKMYEESENSFSGLHCILEGFVRLESSLRGGCWPDSSHLLKQIDKLGKSYTATLAEAGISTFQELSKLDPRKIEYLLGRNPPFGNSILSSLNKLPWFYARGTVMTTPGDPQTLQSLSSEIFITFGLLNPEQVSVKSASGVNFAHLFVTASFGREFRLLTYRRLAISDLKINKDLRLQIPTDICGDIKIKLDIIPEFVSGLELHETYDCPSQKVNFQVPNINIEEDQFSIPDHLLTEEVLAVEQQCTPINSIPGASSAKCRHKCLNRMACGHKCCKTNLLVQDVPDTTISRDEPLLTTAEDTLISEEKSRSDESVLKTPELAIIQPTLPLPSSSSSESIPDERLCTTPGVITCGAKRRRPDFLMTPISPPRYANALTPTTPSTMPCMASTINFNAEKQSNFHFSTPHSVSDRSSSFQFQVGASRLFSQQSVPNDLTVPAHNMQSSNGEQFKAQTQERPFSEHCYSRPNVQPTENDTQSRSEFQDYLNQFKAKFVNASQNDGKCSPFLTSRLTRKKQLKDDLISTANLALIGSLPK